jgi:DEAD/DEAH box helicase domain-containing protein
MADPQTATTPSATRIKLNASFWRHGFCVPFSEDVVPSSLFLRHRHFLVLIETQKLVQEVGGWDHVDKLGISVACAYDSKTDQFMTFLEKDMKKLIELCEERLIVGYNIRGFDLPVMVPYGLELQGLDVFDIMYDVEALTRQRFLKLEAIARGTLGAGKSADGLQAVEWYKSGQIQKIIDYCQQDVKVTRDIFQYGRQNGFIRIQRSEENVSQVSVSWN